ncbi:hypothetical protein CDAR_474801 [Caerostris darwini]|uniref:EGF-like domain-containing protein n=1 Tax=Caerostris darwini TaxID=1538125 RepID=A0AAV4MVW3_9ARAC|nr:hypothetical protein CDAR_474801 [Caerostris darwini]
MRRGGRLSILCRGNKIVIHGGRLSMSFHGDGVGCDCGNHSLSCEILFDDVFCDCEEGYTPRFGKCEECVCGDRSVFCSFKANGEKDCHCVQDYKQAGDDCLECTCEDPLRSCSFDAQNNKVCSCRFGYYEIYGKCYECDCGFNSKGCKIGKDGKKVCDCEEDFTQRLNKCVECDCGNKSKDCHYDEEGDKICLCSRGYGQKNGTCTEICYSDRDCKDGRVCKMAERGDWICDCPTNFTGRQCEKHVLCEKLEPLCSEMGARCLVGDSGAFCRCPFGQTVGLPSGLCEDVCSPDKCLHGTCKPLKLDDVGTTYMCRCDAGYTGKRCEEKIQAGFFTERTAFILLLSSNVGILVLLLGVLYLMCRRRN